LSWFKSMSGSQTSSRIGSIASFDRIVPSCRRVVVSSCRRVVVSSCRCALPSIRLLSRLQRVAARGPISGLALALALAPAAALAGSTSGAALIGSG
jgi:hypothetical protein